MFIYKSLCSQEKVFDFLCHAWNPALIAAGAQKQKNAMLNIIIN